MAAEISAAAICQVCGMRGQSAKRLLVSRHQGGVRKDRKGTKTKDDDDKRKGVCNKCDEGGDPASNCLKESQAIQVKAMEVIRTA